MTSQQAHALREARREDRRRVAERVAGVVKSACLNELGAECDCVSRVLSGVDLVALIDKLLEEE